MFEEKLIEKIVKAFASPRQFSDAETFYEKNKNVEDFYGEFVINRKLSYIDAINIIDTFDDKIFKKKFVEYHQIFKKKQQNMKGNVVAKINGITVINKYTDLTRGNTYETFKEVLDFIKEATGLIKSRGYDFLLYGNLFLDNPKNARTIAEYNYIEDFFRLKLYKSYSGHALEAFIHEFAHRMWYKMLSGGDRDKWKIEYSTKLRSFALGEIKNDFPSEYSKTNEKEYFAEIVTYYIVKGKKFSDLISEIF
jgi:hypothetical protein